MHKSLKGRAPANDQDVIPASESVSNFYKPTLCGRPTQDQLTLFGCPFHSSIVKWVGNHEPRPTVYLVLVPCILQIITFPCRILKKQWSVFQISGTGNNQKKYLFSAFSPVFSPCNFQ